MRGAQFLKDGKVQFTVWNNYTLEPGETNPEDLFQIWKGSASFIDNVWGSVTDYLVDKYDGKDGFVVILVAHDENLKEEIESPRQKVRSVPKKNLDRMGRQFANDGKLKVSPAAKAIASAKRKNNPSAVAGKPGYVRKTVIIRGMKGPRTATRWVKAGSESAVAEEKSLWESFIGLCKEWSSRDSVKE